MDSLAFNGLKSPWSRCETLEKVDRMTVKEGQEWISNGHQCIKEEYGCSCTSLAKKIKKLKGFYEIDGMWPQSNLRW